MSDSLKYRPDIDGLRAIAVLAVIFFHLDYPYFKGGYIGVDIFFVISGYLISQIIYLQIKNRKFSFIIFYKKRILRIFPVLFVLIIICLITGYFVLLNEEYLDLGFSSIASALFIPNILYWFKTGYFEIEAESTPLLHLWSLGVEEQFYILFPLIAFFTLSRFNKSFVLIITITLASVSFYVNIIYTSLDITFSFYMLFSRGWELLAGFLLTLSLPYIKNTNKFVIELLSILGIGLIIFSVYYLDTNILFPGYYAMLPVFGSMLIIFSGSFDKQTFIKRVLSNKYIVFIGLISYSLYLWHWPVVVYLRMAYSNLYLNEVILIISFLLSVISYFFIEQPFRNKGFIKLSLKVKSISIIIMAVLIFTISVSVIKTNGFPNRLSDSVKRASNPKTYLPENRHCHRMTGIDIKNNNFCIFGYENTVPSFALIGDSHAEALKYGLELAAINKKKSGIQFTKPGCRPIRGIDKKGSRRCLRFINIALNEIARNKEINIVFLAGYWSRAYYGFAHNRRKIEYFDYQENSKKYESNDLLFLRGLHRTIEQLIRANKKIVIIEDTPVIEFNPRTTYARNIFLNKEQNIYGKYKEGVNGIIKDEILKYGNSISYMKTEKIICPNNPCKLVKNNELMFRDDDHISKKASALLTKEFEDYLVTPEESINH